MLLVIDNYDSFVFNLARYFQRLGQTTRVVRNTEIDADEVRTLRPDALVLSPGPCTPAQAGACIDIVRRLHAEIPMLGICLGHQAIVEALAGRVVRAAEPVHGRASRIRHDGRGVFADLPQTYLAGRYHSLVVEDSSLPACLEVSARTDDGTIMAVRHCCLPVVGLQFHPESILTEQGYPVLAGFLRQIGQPVPDPLPTPADERSAQP